MLIVFTLAVAGVVLLILTLATETWWLLAPVLLLHAVAFLVATGAVLRSAEQQTKPDPVTEARVEEEASTGESDSSDDEPKMAI
jgi:hypothetical protein